MDIPLHFPYISLLMPIRALNDKRRRDFNALMFLERRLDDGPECSLRLEPISSVAFFPGLLYTFAKLLTKSEL